MAHVGVGAGSPVPLLARHTENAHGKGEFRVDGRPRLVLPTSRPASLRVRVRRTLRSTHDRIQGKLVSLVSGPCYAR